MLTWKLLLKSMLGAGLLSIILYTTVGLVNYDVSVDMVGYYILLYIINLFVLLYSIVKQKEHDEILNAIKNTMKRDKVKKVKFMALFRTQDEVHDILIMTKELEDPVITDEIEISYKIPGKSMRMVGFTKVLCKDISKAFQASNTIEVYYECKLPPDSCNQVHKIGIQKSMEENGWKYAGGSASVR